ncbi:MAG: putative nucleotide-diphospho-sugar transferase [Candidatus Babeliales bacterium]
MKIKKIAILTLLFFISNDIRSEKMKLYALYTPSHTILKNEWFLPSIKKHDDFDLIIESHEQTCSSASFMSTGWTSTTIKKIELIIRAIEENWGKVFIFSDVDIQFFAPIQKKIEKLIKNKDMVVQKNQPNGQLCSGFFACRGNEKTLQLWQDAYQLMVKNEKISDQAALNQCLRGKHKTNRYNLVWDYLPVTFFGAGTLTGCGWKPNKKLPIPKNIVLHHANWTKGIENKIAQLKYVHKIVKERKNK